MVQIMKKRIHTSLLALMIVSIITVSTAFAATIMIEPSQGTISQGTTTEFKLILDSAPDGIAGYNLNLILSNPGVAEITGVVYPTWESLNNTTYLSEGVVRTSGVDIAKMVQPGANEILLGTITVRGVSQGTTGISINSIRMNADGGGVVVPTVTDAQLISPGRWDSNTNLYQQQRRLYRRGWRRRLFRLFIYRQRYNYHCNYDIYSNGSNLSSHTRSDSKHCQSKSDPRSTERDRNSSKCGESGINSTD